MFLLLMTVLTVLILILLIPMIQDILNWFVLVGIYISVSKIGVDYGISLACHLLSPICHFPDVPHPQICYGPGG